MCLRVCECMCVEVCVGASVCVCKGVGGGVRDRLTTMMIRIGQSAEIESKKVEFRHFVTKIRLLF